MWLRISFSKDNWLQATDITTLSIEDIKLLPSNNLKAEKEKLAKLDSKHCSKMQKLQIYCQVDL